MEHLQALNPSLLSVPSVRISPDTPQPPRKASLDVVSSGDEGSKGRRGSFLDISEMDIREGPSDVED